MNQIKINPFRAKLYVIAFDIGNIKYKILQIFFGGDGSIFVNFPYYKKTEGVVSLVTYSKNMTLPADLSLEPRGKVTSHLVKYSHHVSGEALFSQTGHVRTETRKKSIPLHDKKGHIFTVQLQGINHFEVAGEKDSRTSSTKRTTLSFNLGNSEPEATKIVGRWYSNEQIIANRFANTSPMFEVGPKAPIKTSNGKQQWGFLLAPPIDNPSKNYVLILTCEKIPKLNKKEFTTLTFIGGFDHSDIINNMNVDTRFLALLYPTSEYEELKRD